MYCDHLTTAVDLDVGTLVHHVYRTVPVIVQLLEGGWCGGESAKVLRESCPKATDCMEGIEKATLSSCDAVVKPNTVQELNTRGRLIVQQIPVKRELNVAVGCIDRALHCTHIKDFPVDQVLRSSYECSHLLHSAQIHWDTMQDHQSPLGQQGQPLMHSLATSYHITVVELLYRGRERRRTKVEADKRRVVGGVSQDPTRYHTSVPLLLFPGEREEVLPLQ